MHSTIKRGSRLASGASCQPHTQVPSSNNSAAGTCEKQMQHVLKAMPSRHMSSQAAHPQAQAYMQLCATCISAKNDCPQAQQVHTPDQHHLEPIAGSRLLTL